MAQYTPALSESEEKEYQRLSDIVGSTRLSNTQKGDMIESIYDMIYKAKNCKVKDVLTSYDNIGEIFRSAKMVRVEDQNSFRKLQKNLRELAASTMGKYCGVKIG